MLRCRHDLSSIELARQEQQVRVDASRNRHQRNLLGQFATPWPIASQMLAHAADATQSRRQIRFLDPAVGTGVFHSALLATVSPERISSSVGYEVDEEIASVARNLWRDTGLDVRLHDFARARPYPREPKFNLVVCNPPYVRHHHIPADRKVFLNAKLRQQGDMTLSGLAGLYAYFMALTHPWMDKNALAGWLIPGEFMDTGYGGGIRDYLTHRVTLQRVHRFEPEASQFDDALVSSTMVWFVNDPPPENHEVEMSFGGSLQQPAHHQAVPLDLLKANSKWSRFPGNPGPDHDSGPTLGDLFDIKRGIATGNNGFFIIPESEAESLGLPSWALRHVLPGPRLLDSDHITARRDGSPDIRNRRLLLDCRLEEEVVAECSPMLDQYLKSGREQGVPDGYLCRRRSPWYAQEKRGTPPFLSNYMGRVKRYDARPFRFMLNDSTATALNVYLMLYPKGQLAQMLADDPTLKTTIWQALNRIDAGDMIAEGRSYGGGLRKIEPGELKQLPAKEIISLWR